MLGLGAEGRGFNAESTSFSLDFVPPHAPQAEAALLGSLILRPDGLRGAILEPGDFYEVRNRLTYLAICRLGAAGTPIDAVTLAEELQRTEELENAGGVARIVEIMGSVPHAEYLDHYAGQVRDAAARRRVVARASEALRMALRGSDPEQVAAELDAARAALAIADGSAVVRCLADVPAEDLEWLWPGRIPLGKLTLLAGDPGLGKSFLTLDLAARVTTGRAWPGAADEEGAWQRDGDEGVASPSAMLDPTASPPGDVVLFGAEDDLADTVRPRLDAAGADVSRVAAVEGIHGTSGPRGFSLVTDLPRLEAVLAMRPQARLVVIDPITAYCSGVDSHKNADVRALLAPLAELAARRRVAVVAVTHLNKAAGGKAIYRAMGSLAYIAAARVGWLVAKDKDDPTRRLLLPVKNNLAEDVGGLAYRIEEGRIAWERGRIDLDADDALSSGNDAGRAAGRHGDDWPTERRDRAERFLEERLANGPVPVTEILDDAMGAGLSHDQIKRARKRLGVRSERVANGWQLRLNPDPPRHLAGATAELF
jgi:hypothetical protein